MIEAIAAREKGGHDEQNLLKDADSLSFFQAEIDHFLNEQVQKTGIEFVRKKFEWMFQRIDSIQARKGARPLFDNLLNKKRRY